MVLEAVGSESAARLAVDLVRPGGVIAACGVHTDEHLAFSPAEAYDKKIIGKGGRESFVMSPSEAQEAIMQKKLDVEFMAAYTQNHHPGHMAAVGW